MMNKTIALLFLFAALLILCLATVTPAATVTTVTLQFPTGVTYFVDRTGVAHVKPATGLIQLTSTDKINDYLDAGFSYVMAPVGPATTTTCTKGAMSATSYSNTPVQFCYSTNRLMYLGVSP